MAGRTPYFHALYNGTSVESILVGMFPIDLSFLMYFGIPNAGFVGEWFMGVIVILFLLAPLVYFCMRRAPLLTLIASIIISVIVFIPAQEIANEGRILNGFWVSIVRVPEFLFGMILFYYQDFFQLHNKKLLIISAIIVVVGGFIAINMYPEIESPLERMYPLHPRSFILSFPTIYLFFHLLEYLNTLLPKFFEWFNSFSDISYMAMLIQHVIIYEFADHYQYEFFGNFGIFFMLIVNLFTIFYISKLLKKYSDPIESYLMPKRKSSPT